MLMIFFKSIIVSLSTYYLANLVSYQNLTMITGLIVGFYTFIYDDLERELKYNFRNIFQDIFTQYSNLLERNKGMMMEIESVKKESKISKIYLRLKYLKKIISFQKDVNRCHFPFCKELIIGTDQKICKKHNPYPDRKCPICFDENREDLFPLRCYHYIHFKCFKEWVKIQDSQERVRCPVCRKFEPLL
jgi:hypothetical protein